MNMYEIDKVRNSLTCERYKYEICGVSYMYEKSRVFFV